MKSSIVILASAFVMVNGTAYASPQDQNKETAEEEKVAKPEVAKDEDEQISVKAKRNPGDRRVCKKKKRTGTRIARKTCMTADQWDFLEEQRRLEVERAGDGAGTGGFGENPNVSDGSFGPGS